MARFGFGQNFGELNAYPEVRAFEIAFNTTWALYHLLPAESRITGSQITVDEGKYGSEVDDALQRYITFLVRRGHAGCGSVTSAEVRTIGPAAVRQCLVATGMTDAAVSVLQIARDEWKAATRDGGGGGGGGGAIDPYAAARIDCGTRGGTWNTSTNTCTEVGAEDEGLGAGAWIAIALLGALGAYGIYYVAVDDGGKKKR